MSEIPHPNITRLVVRNYRSLKEIDVRLRPLTVLVGENGSGKSNLIDVLRFVRDALTSSLEQAVLMRGGMSALRCWFADQKEPISIHLEFEGPEWEGEYGLAFDSPNSEVELLQERLSLTTFDATSPKKLFFEVVDGQLRGSSLKPNPVMPDSNQLYLSQLAAHSPAVKMVHDLLAKMNFYDLKPDTLRQPQALLTPFPLLETGENLASALLELQKRQEQYLITESLDVIVDGLTGYNVEQVNGHLVTKLDYRFHNGHTRAISSQLRDEADGTIRMLALLTALYQDRFPSLLAIEEPEKTLYTTGLGVCSGLLDETTLRYQVLITTHSSDLINDFEADSFLVVEKEAGISKIGPLIKFQRDILSQKNFLPGELMQMQGLFREGASLRAKV
ncbi:MAG: AAA family ATPase [Ardenticatenaceae bacterium]